MGKRDAAVQMGMFGVPSTLAGSHVVAAHTRTLASGEEVFVAEHVRWNRSGRESVPAPPRRARVTETVDADQIGLFAGPRSSSLQCNGSPLPPVEASTGEHGRNDEDAVDAAAPARDDGLRSGSDDDGPHARCLDLPLFAGSPR